MSAAALLKAVEAKLRALLADPTGKVVGVQPDGRPPPAAGQWYYAVHYAGRRGDGRADDLDTRTGVTVTITAKMALAPRDRRGERMTLDGELLARAEAVIAGGVVHAAYDVLGDANARIAAAGGTTNGFVEPLVFLSDGPVLEKGPDWVGAEGDHPPTVLAIEVRFGQARRVERIH